MNGDILLGLPLHCLEMEFKIQKLGPVENCGQFDMLEKDLSGFEKGKIGPT